MIKLLIFDLDGTIIDSSHDLLNAVNFALEKNVGISVSYNFLKLHIGEPLEKVFSFALIENDINNSTENIPKLIYDFIEYSKIHLVDNSLIFEGLEEFLGRNGRQLQVIATTKPSSTAKRIAQLMNFEKYFDGIFGSENLSPKPDPAIIKKILIHYSISPKEALMIGDTDKDILAGKKAGVNTCLALYGFGDKDKALSLKPDFVVNHPKCLYNIKFM